MLAISLAVRSAALLVVMVADGWTAVRKGEWTELAG